MMATTYYVSQVDGNDTYDGLYPTWEGGLNGPWLTISKADNLTGTRSDDKVLFRRGGTWREMWTLACNGTSGHPFTIGAYGEGNDPKILGSVDTHDYVWTNYSGNGWSATFTAGTPNPVWFINVSDGKTKWGNLKASSVEVASGSEFDWYYASNVLYVNTGGSTAPYDPDTRYTAVEAAVRASGIDAATKSYITIENVEIAYVTQNAIKNGVTGLNATIDGCTVHHAGPMQAASSNGIIVRGSNSVISDNLVYECGTHGIYVTCGVTGQTTTNITVEGNEVYNCYHTGIDVMGTSSGGTINFIYVLRNFLYTTDDYAEDGVYHASGILVSGDAASTISYVTVAYNIVLFFNAESILTLDYCDYLYFYNNVIYGDNPNALVGHVRFYLFTAAEANLTHVTVKNNIAVQANASLTQAAFSVSYKSSITECDYNCWYNAYGGTGKYAAVEGSYYHFDDFEAYKTATTWDEHGLWEDPHFVNAGGTAAEDYKIVADSPCVGAGTDVGLTEDFWGAAIDELPDIGAHEYYPTSHVMPLLRGGRRLREQRIVGIKTGIPVYTAPELTVKGFKLIFYDVSQTKVGELGADVQFGKLSEIEFELLPFGCGAFSFLLDSLPSFPVNYRTRVDVHPYFDPTPWFSGFIQTVPKPGQRPPFRFIGFGFFEQLDWVLVTEAYTNTEVSAIIKDIIENTVAPNTQIAYNESKIEETPYTVTSISFDHTKAKEAIQQLANLVSGYEFGVDDSREFYFRAKHTDVHYHSWAGKQFQEVDLEADPLPVRNKLYIKSGKIQANGTNVVGTVSDSDSITDYGLREEVVTAPDVLDSDDALEWAAQILAEKKVPRVKAAVANVILDQAKTKLEASGKVRITAHDGTPYELPVDRVLYKISKDGVLAELDCEQNPHPFEELLTEQIKITDDEQRLSDKRTKELYDRIVIAEAAIDALETGGAMYVASDVTNSTTTPADVTGLSFAVAANKVYGFHFVLKITGAGNAYPPHIGFTGPSAPTAVWIAVKGHRTNFTGPYQYYYTSFASTPDKEAFPIDYERDTETEVMGYLRNGSNAGTVQMTVDSKTDGQAVTVSAGSSGEWRRLN